MNWEVEPPLSFRRLSRRERITARLVNVAVALCALLFAFLLSLVERLAR